MSHTYKNKTDRTLVLPNIGIVLADGEIKTDQVIENPNLELVTEAAPSQTPQTQPIKENE